MLNDILKVMTFNLKTDFILNHRNRWEKRREPAYAILKKYDCDIIGTQEVSKSIYSDIREYLKEYFIIGNPRSKKLFSERNSILIKKNHKFDKVETFWLSNTPNKEGSSFWYSLFPRICTTAIIKLNNKKCVRVYNTHLDCLTPKAREKELEKIIEHMEKFHQKEMLPTILMGDFNARPNSKLIKSLTERKLNDGRLVAVQEYDKNLYNIGTFRGNKNIHIDYIFVSEEFQIKNVDIIKDNKNGVFPSDHYPLMAELELIDDYKC